MKIQDIELDITNHQFSPVTYIPEHAHGNAGHPDCEYGVIISFTSTTVKVLYCNSRTIQSTQAKHLVWG